MASFALVATMVVPQLDRVSPTFAHAADEPTATRVMPLGDSLTDGYNIPGGYRVHLSERFADGEFAVDFVGSLSNGPGNLMDREHEGHSSFRIDEIAASIDDWLGRNPADIVLLMIGTNDMVQDHRLETAPERLSALIGRIAAAAPISHVIVASIPPMVASPYAERIKACNVHLPGIVSSKVAEDKQVSYVDMYGVIEASDLHTDLIHMNEIGYRKLADAWYSAVRQVLREELERSTRTTERVGARF